MLHLYSVTKCVLPEICSLFMPYMLDSAVLKTQNLLSLCGGFLTYPMYHHEEKINEINKLGHYIWALMRENLSSLVGKPSWVLNNFCVLTTTQSRAKIWRQ